MTIQDCYKEFGGDYAGIKERLYSDALIGRFIRGFLSDDSYDRLCHAMEVGRCEDAFRADHTLNGVSGNLGLTGLYTSAGRLSDHLRSLPESIPADAAPILEEIKQDYALTVAAIRAYLDDVGL